MDEQVALALAKNAAVNGRLVNVMSFILMLFIAVQFNAGAVVFAFFPVLSVGAGFIADRYQSKAFSLISIALAVVPLLSIFYI